MEKEVKGILDGYQDGESRILKVVRQMIGEEPIHQLEIIKRHPEIEPKKPIGAMNVYLYDMESFIEFCKKFGDPKQSVIFYDEEKAVFIKDINLQENWDGEYDNAIAKFNYTRQYQTWNNVINSSQKFDHKQMISFLRANMPYIDGGEEVLYSYENLRTVISIEVDSMLSSKDGREVGIKTRSKTDSKIKPGKLIVTFDLKIPILKGLDDYDILEVHIDLNEPKDAKENVTFQFRSTDFMDAAEIARAREIEKVKAALNGWAIFYGALYFQINAVQDFPGQ